MLIATLSALFLYIYFLRSKLLKVRTYGIETEEIASKQQYYISIFEIICIWIFVLSISANIVLQSILRNTNAIMVFISLIIVFIIGVFFAIIGIAVTVSDELTFHSMAANRIKETRYLVRLVRSTGKIIMILGMKFKIDVLSGSKN